MVVAIGFVAPIVEEIVFRGAILRTMCRAFNKKYKWWAIAISAALFAIAHGNLAQGGHAMILGIMLGWIYIKADSILPGIIFHWINNTTAYIIFTLTKNNRADTLIEMFQHNYLILYTALTLSVIVIFISLYKIKNLK